MCCRFELHLIGGFRDDKMASEDLSVKIVSEYLQQDIHQYEKKLNSLELRNCWSLAKVLLLLVSEYLKKKTERNMPHKFNSL